MQLLLKETMKENKSLQSKNSKLEGKYVELFKENKLLKQDRNNFVSFAASFFTDAEGKSQLQETATGQMDLKEIETLGEQKINGFISKIQEL